MRVEVATENVVGMTLQGLHTFARGQLPNLERLVVGRGDEETRVAGPSNVGNTQSMPGNGFLELAVVSPPYFDKLVCRRGSQPFAVRRELNR